MKRALLGTMLLLAILVVTLLVATRWPTLFWLAVLALLLYLAFGRRAEVELRLGVGTPPGRGAFIWLWPGGAGRRQQRNGQLAKQRIVHRPRSTERLPLRSKRDSSRRYRTRGGLPCRRAWEDRCPGEIAEGT